MARIGLEYIDSFANARAAAVEWNEVEDLDAPYYVGEWFIGILAEAGHEITFARRNQQAGERGLRDASKNGDDEQVADAVDLYFILTHGLYTDNHCELLYDTQADSYVGKSTDWRLGNTCNCEWLLIFGCHSVDKDHLLDHLHVFQGLHLICGAYSWMYDSFTIQEAGQDTARNLICGKPVAESWIDGVSDWWVENHPIVVSVERKEQLHDGEVDWPNTVLHSDHLWGHGTTRADVEPKDHHFMICEWSDQGVWDWG